jgi:hypothetical protein
MKIRRVGVELAHADGHTYVHTYKHDKARSRFSQFGNSPKNEGEQQITWEVST